MYIYMTLSARLGAFGDFDLSQAPLRLRESLR